MSESREAYRANAESPEQHHRYERYRAVLAAEAEWHDEYLGQATRGLRSPPSDHALSHAPGA
jgi:hypothetical protein